jgi:hypothetical protein
LDSIDAGLKTIRDVLLGLTPANTVFTTYYNPIRKSGVWGYVGRTFESVIGAVNAYLGGVVQNPARLALADVKPAFEGHEIGTSCSYIERLSDFPWLPFGVHPNRLGQRVIAGVVLKAAREKGFISGSSSPIVTCLTGQIQMGQVVTLHGADLHSRMSVSIAGIGTEVINVSSDGFNAKLRVPNVLVFIGVGKQVDVVVKNPDGPARRFRVDVMSSELSEP